MRLETLVDKMPRNGRIFSVTYFRKDGTVGHMTGRFGVKKGVHGKGAPYDPKTYGLITMFGMKKGFRNIKAERIVSIKTGGKVFTVDRVAGMMGE